MNKIILSIILLIGTMCSIIPCRKEIMTSIDTKNIVSDPLASKALVDKSDKIVRGKGYVVSELKRTIFEDGNYYYVKYELVKKNALGGGALLTFRKSDMKLFSNCFEQ
jgi:hypothetical protein